MMKTSACMIKKGILSPFLFPKKFVKKITKNLDEAVPKIVKKITKNLDERLLVNFFTKKFRRVSSKKYFS